MTKLKIKLKKIEMVALHDFLVGTINSGQAKCIEEMLVDSLMLETLLQLEKMFNNTEQKKFTLRLTSAQAIAFVAFTSHLELNRFPYEQVLITDILNDIQKANFNASIQY